MKSLETKEAFAGKFVRLGIRGMTVMIKSNQTKLEDHGVTRTRKQ